MTKSPPEQIETHVKFRMGKWYDRPYTPTLDSEKFRINVFGILISSGLSDLEFRTMNGCNKHGISGIDCRATQIFRFMIDHRIETHGFPIFIDPDDASSYCNSDIPIFTGARPVDGDDSLIYLLACQTRMFYENWAEKDPYDWNAKKNEAIYRGNAHGSIDVRDNIDYPSHITFYQTVDAYAKGSENFYHIFGNPNNSLEEVLMQIPRYAIIKKWHDKLDVGFLGGQLDRNKNLYLAITPDMIKPFVPEVDQCKYKYMIVAEGNDFASSLSFALTTNSVTISPPPSWNSVFCVDLKPWVHYVPIKKDASDLGDVIEWCRENDDECRQISENASEYIGQFTLDNEIGIYRRMFEVMKENSK